ncbi:uncharacterized protein BO88DRAFT_407084 [Aspergillus vadensis CBS 113365]|uniref:Secreted protein n=1 Tax=Aspergillus vadensis (strain CBS 113365 / IMI 142717 / IBT 24658) TaxID=1448311 RepID=A0A319B0Y6_ASPVC|nr:hypothetical protein BO88DRAFT_407084 [Aspergillus vadensis CBS 113365]PYH66149.1 hypothetical protein BO88DRAFT_407084 [Aspergillus vadensis CBS 113365]
MKNDPPQFTRWNVQLSIAFLLQFQLSAIHSFDPVPLPGPSVSLRSLIAWLNPSACRRRHGYGPWSVSGPFGMATSRVYCQCSFAILTNPPPILPVFLQFFPHE